MEIVERAKAIITKRYPEVNNVGVDHTGTYVEVEDGPAATEFVLGWSINYE